MQTTFCRTLTIGLGLAALTTGVVRSDVDAAARTPLSSPLIKEIVPHTFVPDRNPRMVTIGGQDFQSRLVLNVRTPDGRSVDYKDEAIRGWRENSFRVAVMFDIDGQYVFKVTNPDGGVSDPFLLKVPAQQTPPSPVIERIAPTEVLKNPEPQSLRVHGRHFGDGLRAIVTDPMGMEVIDPIVRDVTPQSFTLVLRLATAGQYSLVVSQETGAASNVATIVVK
jgi:hypothetical protein